MDVSKKLKKKKKNWRKIKDLEKFLIQSKQDRFTTCFKTCETGSLCKNVFKKWRVKHKSCVSVWFQFGENKITFVLFAQQQNYFVYKHQSCWSEFAVVQFGYWVDTLTNSKKRERGELKGKECSKKTKFLLSLQSRQGVA